MTIKKWRWLCIECNAEGRGMTPDACPACGADDAWFETNRASDDDRPMTEIFADFRKQFRKKPQ